MFANSVVGVHATFGQWVTLIFQTGESYDTTTGDVVRTPPTEVPRVRGRLRDITAADRRVFAEELIVQASKTLVLNGTAWNGTIDTTTRALINDETYEVVGVHESRVAGVLVQIRCLVARR